MTQQNTGITRSSIQWNHALMCPESHVPIMFPQWQGATSVVMISPEMGAKFSQHMITLETATLTPLRAEDQMFALLLEGEVTVEAGDGDQRLTRRGEVADHARVRAIEAEIGHGLFAHHRPGIEPACQRQLR